MDRGSKPPPSHPFVTWACDREAHTTGCMLKGSRVVGTWETGPILGDPCCVEMRTLLQCVCPRHRGDSASVGSLSCHFSSYLFTQSHHHLTLPFSYLFLLFPPLLPLPVSFPAFLLASLLFLSLPLSPTSLPSVHHRADLSAPYGSTACKSMHFPSSSSLTKMTPSELFLEL